MRCKLSWLFWARLVALKRSTRCEPVRASESNGSGKCRNEAIWRVGESSISPLEADEGTGVDEADIAGRVTYGNQTESAAAVQDALAGAQEIERIPFIAGGKRDPARAQVEPVAESGLPAKVPGPGVVGVVADIDEWAGEGRIAHLREAVIA